MFSARYTPELSKNSKDNSNAIKLNKFPFKRKREESSDSEESSTSESDSIDDDVDMDENEGEALHGSEFKSDLPSEDESEEDVKSNSDNVETNTVVDNVVDANESDTLKNTLESENLTENKHASVFERFKQTINLQDKFSQDDEQDTGLQDGEDVELHDLIPIPQPSKVYLPKIKDAFLNESWSHLNKIYYDMSEEAKWSDIHSQGLINDIIYDNITNNLKFNQVMPVQNSIFQNYLPILLKAYSVSKTAYTFKAGDVLINSFTGSGKTLAYVVPILQILMERKIKKLRCVIVLPTTILIQQVYSTIVSLCKNSDLVVATTKPNSMSLKEEVEKFKNLDMDILITTPGRLVDHLNLNNLHFNDLKFLVMDESDKLLNQSYQDWVKVVMKAIENIKVCKFVVSATLTKNTEKLELLKLNPTRTNLFLLRDEEDDGESNSNGIYQLPKGLHEYNMKLKFKDSLHKPMYLAKLLDLIQKTSEKSGDNSKILVFVNSNQSSLRLTPLISKIVSYYSQNINIYSMNSNNSNLQNKQALENFDKNKGFSVLITTDVMSRGIDLLITDVINYNLPISSQQYVHRVGRTARGMNKIIGNVYNIFVGNDDYKYYTNQIERYLKRFSNGDNEIRAIVDKMNTDLAAISQSIPDRSPEAVAYKNILKEFTR